LNQATEIYSREFDAIFSKLPAAARTRIIADIRDLGRRLESFPHRRLQGRPEFRLRVGDYRVIYLFDVQRNELFLSTLGHRRDVYRF
jgi:mRNA interferase RelE/StbE